MEKIKSKTRRDYSKYQKEYREHKKQNAAVARVYVYQYVSDETNLPFIVTFGTLSNIIESKHLGREFKAMAAKGYSVEILHKDLDPRDAKRVVTDLIFKYKYISEGGSLINIRNKYNYTKANKYLAPKLTIENINTMQAYVRSLDFNKMNKTEESFYSKFIEYNDTTYNLGKMCAFTGISKPSVKKYLTLIASEFNFNCC